MNAAADLDLLIRSRYPIITAETADESRLVEVLRRVAAGRGIPFLKWSRTEGLMRDRLDSPVYDTQDPAKALAHIKSSDIDGVFLLADFQPYFTDPVVARRLREVAATCAGDRRALVMSGQSIELPAELRRHSVPFVLSLPDPGEVFDEVRRVVQEFKSAGRVKVELTQEEAEAFARALQGLTREEIRRAVYRAILDDGRLERADIARALEVKHEALGGEGLLEFFPPADEPESVGGMARLKEWLSKRRTALSAEARQFGLEPPKGILLLGVQGCGKSLLARSVAAEWHLPLVRLDPGALYDKFIGETEKNLKRALATVESMAPLVLWIDEIEKGFTGGGGEEDGGTSARLLGSFLTWFQEREPGVFVVATANNVAALPPELLRKGRFDELFFIDLPRPDIRQEILALHLERRDRQPADYDLGRLAERSNGFSGAELEQAVVAGLYTAFAEKSELTTEILLREIEAAVPLSVTMAERVSSLRSWASERTVPAA
ncbi:MAG: AAA family ATPase [Gemmatimonadota bacterium]